MKKLGKVLASVLAVVMLIVCSLSFTACEDLKKLEIKMNVYDTTGKAYQEETLSLDLYRHLAPETVDAVINAVKDDYYDGTFFYQYTSQIDLVSIMGRTDAYNSYVAAMSNQIMIGDLKYVDGEIVKNDKQVPTVKGEFKSNGLVGNNITSAKGTVGLWRSWYESGDDYRSTSKSSDSGRATLYMPTAGEINGYTNYFCAFGKFDIKNTDVEKLFDSINAFFSNSDLSEKFVIYYTGEYSEQGDDNGLTFHCVPTTEFAKLSQTEKDEIFVAEGDQLVCYSPLEICVAFSNKGNQSKKAPACTIDDVIVK